MDTTPPPTDGLLATHALPVPATNVAVAVTSVRPPKHFLAAFFLSFFLGVFGADRLYLGYYVTGVIKMLTFGVFGIGAIVDLALIMNGAMRDRHDQPLAGYEEYKALARKTVFWVSVGIAVFVIVNGVILFFAIEQVVSHLSGLTSGLSGGLGGSTGGGSGSSIDYNSILKSLQ